MLWNTRIITQHKIGVVHALQEFKPRRRWEAQPALKKKKKGKINASSDVARHVLPSEVPGVYPSNKFIQNICLK